MPFAKKIRVLVVDDSAVIRQLVTNILKQDSAIEVIGQASDPYQAHDRIVELKPDVLTLDLEMPKMDGLTFLKILMEKHPMPVIVFSTLTREGSRFALDAMHLGAVDVLGKPTGETSKRELAEQLIQKVKAAACTRKITRPPPARPRAQSTAPARAVKDLKFSSRKLILLGASTGGTEAIREVLVNLPPTMPGILIVQHIPAKFSYAFANRLNDLCALRVKEAEEGDIAAPGTALIAPGGLHMIVRWTGQHYKVNLKDGPMVWHQRPAVDILFKSAVSVVGKHAIAGILTGMGKDGAEGMLELKRAGAQTFAQSEETCVVFGMPRAALESGATQQMLPLQKIATTLQTLAVQKQNLLTQP